MSEIVTLRHNEPMTTSLAIAEGVEMEHHSVLVLLKKHVDHLAEFGGVEFQIQPFETNGGRQWRDVYFLNEQQSTLLITFMRNSPVVINFKKALVRAFFELRDQIKSASFPQRFSDPGVLVPSHEADKIVASDRVFRAAHRSARAAGMSTWEANALARQIAVKATGVDLAGMIIQAKEASRLKPASHGADLYVALWATGERPPAYQIDADRYELHSDYVAWSRENRYAALSEDDFSPVIWRALWPLRKIEIERRKLAKDGASED